VTLKILTPHLRLNFVNLHFLALSVLFVNHLLIQRLPHFQLLKSDFIFTPVFVFLLLLGYLLNVIEHPQVVLLLGRFVVFGLWILFGHTHYLFNLGFPLFLLLISCLLLNDHVFILLLLQLHSTFPFFNNFELCLLPILLGLLNNTLQPRHLFNFLFLRLFVLLNLFFSYSQNELFIKSLLLLRLISLSTVLDENLRVPRFLLKLYLLLLLLLLEQFPSVVLRHLLNLSLEELVVLPGVLALCLHFLINLPIQIILHFDLKILLNLLLSFNILLILPGIIFHKCCPFLFLVSFKLDF